MLFDTLALISLLIIILLLRKMVNVFPSLIACIFRWKENVNLEMSVKLSRDRDILACAIVLPFCLTACRFRLYAPDFTSGLQENALTGLYIGIFLCYALLRTILNAIFRHKTARPSTFNTAISASYTFFIILTLILLATDGLFTFSGVDPETTKIAMIWISAIIYTVFLLRKVQIFASSYNFFTVFLYLCALEIVPTGVLVTSAMIF